MLDKYYFITQRKNIEEYITPRSWVKTLSTAVLQNLEPTKSKIIYKTK